MRKKTKNLMIAVMLGILLIAAVALFLSGGGLQSTISGMGCDTIPVLDSKGNIVQSFSDLRSVSGQSYTDAEFQNFGYVLQSDGMYIIACEKV